MMMVVVLIFAVCWLPFHAYFLLTSCYPAITEAPFIQEIYLLIYWLAMSNSMYNPIIYCWMNSRFRFGFKMFFRWCPFMRVGRDSLHDQSNMTSRYSCSGSPDHNHIKRNVNLSVADAMVSCLNVTFNYIYMLNNDWPFGELYCKISQFIAILTISASVFTLMAISIDRYVAIMKPFKRRRMSKRCNLGIAAVIWIASAIISTPMLLFFTTSHIFTVDGMRTVCYPEWPDGTTNHSRLEYIYNILFMILTYFLPIISMTVTYSRVGFELWGSKAIGEYTPRQVENIKSKRRVSYSKYTSIE
uniref:G-protein coupled receptors family 1 profile domain-containing protein n=1 Tax=Glossina austeni TaxID=7395 RepID=A0A1A9VSM4_GLOAU